MPFDPGDLAGVASIVVAFLAVGAGIVIGLTVYRLGKRAAGRV